LTSDGGGHGERKEGTGRSSSGASKKERESPYRGEGGPGVSTKPPRQLTGSRVIGRNDGGNEDGPLVRLITANGSADKLLENIPQETDPGETNKGKVHTLPWGRNKPPNEGCEGQ